ncbi:MAG: MFS transporter [Propionibacteriaceae bacterium]|jgi:MFS family permease|nr:MFS transporter [Propionibacteriaceae bacterium]
MSGLLVDITPLRRSPGFRRLWWGQGLAAIGGQFTTMAVSLEVYDLTRSTFMVGLLGVFAVVPLVLLGFWGGSVIDTHDRRTVALISALVMWAATIGLAVEAWFHLDNIWLLYAMVGVQSGAGAINMPARTAVIPRLVDRDLLPAANALNSVTWTLALMVGPLLGSVAVAAFGYQAAYTVDVCTFLAALYAVVRLPPIKPLTGEGAGAVSGEATVPIPDAASGEGSGALPHAASGEIPQSPRFGHTWRMMVDGFRFLATHPTVAMTLFMDLAANVFAQPVAMYPAVAKEMIGGGPTTAGWLASFVAIGSVVAILFSGPLGKVRRQGRVVAIMVTGWGLGILGFGVVLTLVGSTHPDHVIGWALAGSAICLSFAGACDSFSSVFRNTILQSATPDRLQGRLQGIFTVNTNGGPNLGKVFCGSMSQALGHVSPVPLGLTAVIGGGLCMATAALLAKLLPSFWKYDARAER